MFTLITAAHRAETDSNFDNVASHTELVDIQA